MTEVLLDNSKAEAISYSGCEVLRGIRFVKRYLRLVIFCLIYLLFAAQSASAHDAQDLFNSGKRTAFLDDLARSRGDWNIPRLDGSASWGLDLSFDMRHFSGVPVLREETRESSAVQRLQGSALLSIEDALFGRDFRYFVGAHIARYRFSSAVPFSLPDDGARHAAPEYGTAESILDMLFDFRVLYSSFLALRAGWIQSDAFAAREDGQNPQDGSNAERVTRDRTWVFDAEALSLLRFTYRMDSGRHPEYWSLSSDFASLLIQWLGAKRKESGFFDYLFENKPLAGRRAEILENEYPLITFALQAENYYHGYAEHTRAAGTHNYSYDMDVKKRFRLDRGARLDIISRLSVFSPGYADWQRNEWLREISGGIEIAVVLNNNDIGNTLLDPLVKNSVSGRRSISNGFYIRGGRFVDSAATAFRSDAEIAVFGYRVGIWFSFWNTINITLSYSDSYADDLRYFAELRDRGVLALLASYSY